MVETYTKEQVLEALDRDHQQILMSIKNAYVLNTDAANKKYQEMVENIKENFDWEMAIRNNLLPDFPYSEHTICGDGIRERWQMDFKPIHIAAVKTPDGLKTIIGADIDGSDIVIAPPLPDGVIVKIAYQFEGMMPENTDMATWELLLSKIEDDILSTERVLVHMNTIWVDGNNEDLAKATAHMGGLLATLKRKRMQTLHFMNNRPSAENGYPPIYKDGKIVEFPPIE